MLRPILFKILLRNLILNSDNTEVVVFFGLKHLRSKLSDDILSLDITWGLQYDCEEDIFYCTY